jgi:oligosaccharide repeat unit polymerase
MVRNIIRISKFMNPAILFCSIWVFTILLFSFNLSDYVEESSMFSVLYIVFSILVILIIGTPLKLRVPKVDLDGYKLNNLNIKIVSICFLSLLIFEVISEISYFGTLPFLASFSLSFDGVDYNEVGKIFKFKHNIFVKANSIFLSGFYFFLYHFGEKKKKYLIGYILILAISLLYISRSTLLSIASITFMIYVIKKPLKLKLIIYILFALVLISYVFDKLYFIRNMGDQNFYLNKYEDLGFIDSVIRGFEGIYVYIASPISNLFHNIDIGTFSNYEFRPSYIIRPFLPADLANLIFGPIDFNDTVYFPNDSNTFTTFPSMLFAFGLIGNIVFYLIFLALSMKYIYYKLILNPYKWLLILIFFNHIVLFSIFSSSFFNIIYYFPLVIAYLFPPLKKIKIV